MTLSNEFNRTFLGNISTEIIDEDLFVNVRNLYEFVIQCQITMQNAIESRLKDGEGPLSMLLSDLSEVDDELTFNWIRCDPSESDRPPTNSSCEDSLCLVSVEFFLLVLVVRLHL